MEACNHRCIIGLGIALAIVFNKFVDFSGLRERNCVVGVVMRDCNAKGKLRFAKFCDLPLGLKQVLELGNFLRGRTSGNSVVHVYSKDDGPCW